MGELIALYGTLMSGLERRPGAPDLAAHIEPLGECTLSGLLYDVGAYPGMVAGEGTVSGELWRTISPTALEILDEWEQYQPARERASVYVRRRVFVLEPEVQAWVYLWNKATTGLELIQSGDWRAQLASRA